MGDDNEQAPSSGPRQKVKLNDTTRIVVQSNAFCFTLSRYNDFKCYAWSRFYRNKDYGEIGRGSTYRGDPQSVTPMQDGYVYVFKGRSDAKLWKAFELKSGQYQGLAVSGGAVNYKSKVGSALPYAKIDNFFSGEHDIPEPIFIVDSNIKLTDKRLEGEAYSIAKAPDKRGFRFEYSRSRMKDAPTKQPSGAEILDAYRSGGSVTSVNFYHLKLSNFDGIAGVDIRRQDPFKESQRRNQIYRQRVQKYYGWLNNKQRNKEAYIHQTLQAVLKMDSGRSSNLNMDKFKQWSRDDSEAYRTNFFPVHYAVESLLECLEDELFIQWLLDYNRSEDDDVQVAGLAAYVEGILDLSLNGKGLKWLSDQFKDDASFFNLATHVPEIRRSYTDPAAHSNFAVEVRKTSNVVFAGLQEYAKVIFKDNKSTGLASKFNEWASKHGAKLQLKQGKASRIAAQVIEHIDTDHLEKWAKGSANFADGFKGRSIVTFFEVINLGIAMKAVSDAYHEDKKPGYSTNLFFAMLNAAGATADIAAAGLLEKQTQKLLAHRGWPASRIYFLAVFSGLVDAVVGIRSASQEFGSGDYDAALGWIVFSVGGAIVATGGAMAAAGVTITVGSAGAAVEVGGPLILLGFFVEAIGLAWVWLANDDELDDWMKVSRFGKNPRLGVDDEIKAINDLMCKFEVDAEFKSDFHVQLQIKPRLFTQQSTMKLTSLHSEAEFRAVEVWGDKHDHVTGMAGLGEVIIPADKPPRNVKFVTDNKRVKEIQVDLFGKQDIDAIRGNAKLEVGPGGFIHGYSTKFRLEAGIFEG